MRVDEFLVARIAERIEAAKANQAGPERERTISDLHAVVMVAALAGNHARRFEEQVVAAGAGLVRGSLDSPTNVRLLAEHNTSEVCCRLLALPYAGHPDFREEWRLGVS